MRDKEFVLRFYAFYRFFKDYRPPLDRFLDFAMQSIYKTEQNLLDEVRDRFSEAMQTCIHIFGNKAFYVLHSNGKVLSTTPNIALFETWAAGLTHLSIAEHINIRNNYREVFQGFLDLFQDIEFHKSITSTTTKQSMVELRFSLIEDLIYKNKYA